MELNCMINDDIKVRKATVNDINSIVRIKINSWKKNIKNILDNEFLNNMNYDENYEKFYKEIKNLDSIKQNYVITKNDKIVNMIHKFMQFILMVNIREKFMEQIYLIM